MHMRVIDIGQGEATVAFHVKEEDGEIACRSMGTDTCRRTGMMHAADREDACRSMGKDTCRRTGRMDAADREDACSG